MFVCDIMTKNVYTIPVDKKLNIAKEIMQWAQIRHIPVVDKDENLVGLISSHDLFKASISIMSNGKFVSESLQAKHLWQISVENIMIKDIATVRPDTLVQQAAQIMRKNKIGCLPVLGLKCSKLLGIVTESDMLKLIERLAVHGLLKDLKEKITPTFCRELPNPRKNFWK